MYLYFYLEIYYLFLWPESIYLIRQSQIRKRIWAGGRSGGKYERGAGAGARTGVGIRNGEGGLETVTGTGANIKDGSGARLEVGARNGNWTGNGAYSDGGGYSSTFLELRAVEMAKLILDYTLSPFWGPLWRWQQDIVTISKLN